MFGIRDAVRACLPAGALTLTVVVSLFSSQASSRENVLYAFCTEKNCADGSNPSLYGGLIIDSAGNLVGTTQNGGAYNAGTVFRIAPGGTETVLHSFQPCGCNGSDGMWPMGGVIADSAGNFYGTTWAGGSKGEGSVFKLAPDGTETILYSFCAQANCSDGETPWSGLILDSIGNLYGTTLQGGTAGGGTAFRIAPDGTETVLYNFCTQSQCTDGESPVAGLILDKQGNLYGTASGGGAVGSCGGGGCGVVFKIAPNGTETVLHSFCGDCDDGIYPMSSLIMDGSGNLYGAAGFGGTVFKLAPDGTETVLYQFCSVKHCVDGARPMGPLLADRAGNLYGTTQYGGGTNRHNRKGVVFKLAPNGVETVLYSFCSQTNCTDGAVPLSGVVMDKAGYLYGTTSLGGNVRSNGSSFGTVFSVKGPIQLTSH